MNSFRRLPFRHIDALIGAILYPECITKRIIEIFSILVYCFRIHGVPAALFRCALATKRIPILIWTVSDEGLCPWANFYLGRKAELRRFEIQVGSAPFFLASSTAAKRVGYYDEMNSRSSVTYFRYCASAAVFGCSLCVVYRSSICERVSASRRGSCKSSVTSTQKKV